MVLKHTTCFEQAASAADPTVEIMRITATAWTMITATAVHEKIRTVKRVGQQQITIELVITKATRLKNVTTVLAMVPPYGAINMAMLHKDILKLEAMRCIISQVRRHC